MAEHPPAHAQGREEAGAGGVGTQVGVGTQGRVPSWILVHTHVNQYKAGGAGLSPTLGSRIDPYAAAWGRGWIQGR